MKNLLLLLLTLCAFDLTSQFVILDDIANGNVSGLGTTINAFNNKSQNQLYFEGSENQFNYKIYKSDGTVGGTTIAGSSSALKNTDVVVFGEKKSYIIDFDGGRKLKISDGTAAGTSIINYFNGKSFGNPYLMGEKALLFSSSSDEIYTTDGTDAGSYFLGSLEGSSFNNVVSTNDSIGIILDDGFTPNYEPRIIHNNATQMSTLVDYLAPVIVLEEIRSANVFKEFITFQGVQNGSVKDFIYNLETKTVSDFDFVGKVVASAEVNGKYVLITNFDAIGFDPVTLTSEELVNRAFAFTTTTVANGKMYFVGDNGSGFQYIESDGTKAGTRGLPNTSVSTSSFNPRQVVYNNALFYIEVQSTSQPKLLISYDLASDTKTTIGQVSSPTNGLIFTQGLYVVNDKLVLSRFTSEKGHELYVYDPTTNVFDPLLDFDVKLTSSLVSTSVSYTTNFALEAVEIFTKNGSKVLNHSPQSHTDIDVTNLVSGIYFIRFMGDRGAKTLEFYKQ